MKSDQFSFRPGFRLSAGNARSQAAVMVLAAGGKEGGPDNYHRRADQWLLVLEGTGAAIINGHKTRLNPGKMVLIEAGDRHEIRNTGARSSRPSVCTCRLLISMQRQNFPPEEAMSDVASSHRAEAQRLIIQPDQASAVRRTGCHWRCSVRNRRRRR
jgi:quercetin dioxygenase-like cupin family protein